MNQDNQIKYDINQVTGRLASRIANLEMELAHSQALNRAYEKEIERLKEEKAE